MTQISMTITGSAATLARVLAALDGGSSLPVVGTLAPTAPVTLDDDDDAPEATVTAPVMPEVVAVAPTVQGEPSFDVTGLAWDERIHAASKTATQDGKWRKKKGVEPAVFAAVEAELRARYAAPLVQTAPVMQVAPAPVSAPVVMEQPVVAVAPAFEQPAAVPQPMPVPMPIQTYNPAPPTDMVAQQPAPVQVTPVMPVAQVAPTPMHVPPAPTVTFHDLMQMVGAKMGTGELTTDYLIQTVNEVNAGMNLALNSFTDMADKPHAVSYCWQIFQRDGKV